jgi:hypothetical protein
MGPYGRGGGGWKSPMRVQQRLRQHFGYPGTPGSRPETGMQQLIERGMSMLREHAPEIADQAQAAYAKYKPQVEAFAQQAGERGKAVYDYRTGVRKEVREGLKAGKSSADIKAGLADNISAFSTAWKPKDAAKFNEFVTKRAGKRVDRMSARYTRRQARRARIQPITPPGG